MRSYTPFSIGAPYQKSGLAQGVAFLPCTAPVIIATLEVSSRPVITTPSDAIVRIIKKTIFGSYLHIMKGGTPAVTEGRILAHEGVDIVEQSGDRVTIFNVGDHVIISLASRCAKCNN